MTRHEFDLALEEYCAQHGVTDAVSTFTLRALETCAYESIAVADAARWITVCVTNARTSLWRPRRARHEVPLEDAVHVSTPPPYEAEVDFGTLLNTLRPIDRALLEQVAAGASLLDAARNLGLSYGYVRRRVPELRRRLKERWGNPGETR